MDDSRGTVYGIPIILDFAWSFWLAGEMTRTAWFEDAWMRFIRRTVSLVKKDGRGNI
jgi:hypothetical protein